MSHKTLALFPLKLFLLPGDYTQLYIFEERYKNLVKDCSAGNLPFGIPFFGKDNMGQYGSLVEITEVVKTYHGGEMDIIVKCIGVFTVHAFQSETEQVDYPSGEVEVLEHLRNYRASSDLKKTFFQYMDTLERVYADELSKKEVSVFEIANELYLSDYQKMDLLKCNDLEATNDFLKNYIHYLYLLEEQEKSVYQNIYLN